MGSFKDLTGQHFGRLTALESLPPHGKNSSRLWLCECECGEIAIVRGTDLTNGHTMSCGCYRKMKKAVPMSELRLHRIWSNMKQRCANPNKRDFKYYGARGISVCEEWRQDFWNFYHWAMLNGYKDGLTIERVDYDGNYEPSNCKWIKATEQQRNMRTNRVFEVFGRRFTLTELCRLYGQPRSTVTDRPDKGQPLLTALKKNGRYKLDNRLLELSDRLKELRDKKGDLEYEVKQVNGEIENITTEMIGLMTTDELSSFNRNGVTFSLVTQEYPAPEPERKPELWAAMKEQGFEHLFTINAQTLQAMVKELIAENDGVLPTWLDGLVKIAEKNSIRLTKSKK